MPKLWQPMCKITALGSFSSILSYSNRLKNGIQFNLNVKSWARALRPCESLEFLLKSEMLTIRPNIPAMKLGVGFFVEYFTKWETFRSSLYETNANRVWRINQLKNVLVPNEWVNASARNRLCVMWKKMENIQCWMGTFTWIPNTKHKLQRLNVGRLTNWYNRNES